MPGLLTVEHLTKSFGGLTAVSNVSLIVEADTVHGIIGPNGAGKSTLLNLIGGEFKPSSGRIALGAQDIVRQSTHRRVFLGIARSFQSPELLTESTVGENVALGYHCQGRSGMLGSVLGLPRERRERRLALQAAEGVLAYVGLDLPLDMPASTLPYGHRKMLEIARGLMSRPTLLLLDEPAAGMNESERSHLRDVVRRLRSDGITVLIIEHHMDVVMTLSDTVTVLAQGEKIAEGTPADLQEDPVVIEAYLGGTQ